MIIVELARTFSFGLTPKAPYDFELTVRKPAGWDLFTPFETYHDGILHTALHLGDMLVGLRLSSTGTTDHPKVHVTLFSEKELVPARKQLAKQSVSRMLGAEDDLAEFYAVARRDRILKHTLEDLRGMHDTYSSGVFGPALLAICLQMAPLKRSEAMMRSIIERYGEETEFDGKDVFVWPLPRKIATLEPEELARSCRLGYRAKRIVELAKFLVEKGFPEMEELAGLPPEDAKRRLMELPGIGDYSADIINPRSGFPIDVWSADVFGKLFYGREPRNARKAVEKVKAEGVRRWGEWSWMAFFYIAQDLRNLSRKLGLRLRLQ